MAITILYSPQLVQPVYNDIVFVVDSTNKTECSFEYIADIYVGGVFKTRLKKFPNPDGYAEFRVNKIIADYLSFDLHEGLNGVDTNPNSIVDYQVKFGESYDSSALCDAGATLYTNLTNSTLSYAFNGVIQDLDYNDWDYTDYKPNDTTTRLLTNLPDDLSIGINDSYYINFLQLNSGSVDYVKFTFYDINKNYVDEVSTANTYATVSSTARRIITVSCGPADIEAIAPGYFTSNVAYYTVSLLDGLTDVSEAKWFYLNNVCTGHETRFLFLGRLGGMEAYTFKAINTRKMSINRNEYTKLNGEYVISPSSWNKPKEGRGRSILSVNATDKMSVESGWIYAAEALWLEELFTSPEVYVYKDGELVPIIITSTDWEEKPKRSLSLIKYTLTYEYAFNKIIQSN